MNWNKFFKVNELICWDLKFKWGLLSIWIFHNYSLAFLYCSLYSALSGYGFKDAFIWWLFSLFTWCLAGTIFKYWHPHFLNVFLPKYRAIVNE